MLIPAALWAAQEDVNVVEETADYAFGQELRFSLLAQSIAPVEKVTLSIRPELSNSVYVIDVPFEKGEILSVSQTVSAKDLELRPFGEVSYTWTLQTAAGDQEIAGRTFVYEDDRFDWKATTRGPISAHWIGGEPIFGQSILDMAEGALTRIRENIPLGDSGHIDIYIYPSSADILSGLRLAGEDMTETDLRDLGVILVTSVNEQTAGADLQQSIPYEMAHMLLVRLSGRLPAAIPWWFREGIALNAQPDGNPRHEQLLADALQTGQTIPLWRLCEEPVTGGDRAELARAQSASVVSFLYSDRPSNAAADLLAAYLQGSSCEAAVQEVLGWSVDDLENAWLDSLSPPSAAQELFQDFGLWILLFILGLVLTWLLIRTSRKREN
jgi:Peptidase MA superfamily